MVQSKDAVGAESVDSDASYSSARDTSSDHGTGSVDRDLESAAGGADAAGVLLKSPSRISRG